MGRKDLIYCLLSTSTLLIPSLVTFTLLLLYFTPPSPLLSTLLIPFFSLLSYKLSYAALQALKFGPVTGLPDESEFVIYGAACKTFGPMGTSKD